PLKSGRQLTDLSVVAVLVVAALGLAVLNHKRHVANKREKDTIRRSEERFQSLARNAFDMVTVLKADGTILYESPAIERVLGYDAEERIGQNGLDYSHPEDQRRAQDILEPSIDAPGVLMQLEAL